MGFPGDPSSKEAACQCRFDPWVRKIPWRRAWQPTPVFLSGKSPGTEEPGALQSMGLQRDTTEAIWDTPTCCKLLLAPNLWTCKFVIDCTALLVILKDMQIKAIVGHICGTPLKFMAPPAQPQWPSSVQQLQNSPIFSAHNRTLGSSIYFLSISSFKSLAIKLKTGNTNQNSSHFLESGTSGTKNPGELKISGNLPGGQLPTGSLIAE